jgi:hypothetical protein
VRAAHPSVWGWWLDIANRPELVTRFLKLGKALIGEKELEGKNRSLGNLVSQLSMAPF